MREGTRIGSGVFFGGKFEFLFLLCRSLFVIVLGSTFWKVVYKGVKNLAMTAHLVLMSQLPGNFTPLYTTFCVPID